MKTLAFNLPDEVHGSFLKIVEKKFGRKMLMSLALRNLVEEYIKKHSNENLNN